MYIMQRTAVAFKCVISRFQLWKQYDRPDGPHTSYALTHLAQVIRCCRRQYCIGVFGAKIVHNVHLLLYLWLLIADFETRRDSAIGEWRTPWIKLHTVTHQEIRIYSRRSTSHRLVMGSNRRCTIIMLTLVLKAYRRVIEVLISLTRVGYRTRANEYQYPLSAQNGLSTTIS